jgi:tetratricopeptide (TPR) repeat protein
MAVDPARVKSLFLAASDLASPAERAAYLDRECGGDAELRARVEALLAADAGPGQYPEPESAGTSATTAPLDATGATAPETSASSELATGAQQPGLHTTAVDTLPVDQADLSVAGRVIAGRYTLLEVLGEGGMGTVYRADQTQPVRRQVALKLIKIGMDSRAVLARFDAERQALALMDHPNIARVYDGGTTESNQPFFVMELVQGVPITDYCDQTRLSVRARLELFVAVCQAVQHAHQKGVIHRDLKPSNVMVTDVDGRPTPKVIDFGVATATEFDLTDQSLGDTGAIVGTPTYMSPEQADPSSMDIDTRTDVYALGVILYELLAGSPPIDAKQFKRGAILEMLRVMREVDPPRPSSKVSTADSLPNIAACRDITPEHLKKALTGDLDWIVMKALEKDRSRRYETANGFAADVLRHLAFEPVFAAPPSRAYRLRKFVRKHRGGVIAASLVLLALIGGIIGTSLGLIQARTQQRRAAAGEELAGERLVQVESEKKKAEEEEQIAVAVKNFLQNKLLGQADVRAQARALLAAGRPSAAAKKDTTIRELLDRAAEGLSEAKIEASFPNQPLLQAEILLTVGDTYRGVGDPVRAIGLLQRSLALRKARRGPDHPDTLTSMHHLARAYQAAGKVDLALPLHNDTLKLRRAKLGSGHPDTLASMNNLAAAYLGVGDTNLALPLINETLELQKATLGPEHPDTLDSMNNLAAAYEKAGKLDLALPLYKETLELQKATLGPEYPDTLASMNNLAVAYTKAGKPDLALPLIEETLGLQRAKLGSEHPDTLSSMNNLAETYRAAGKLDRAVPLMEKTFKLTKAKLGPEHPDTLASMNNLAVAYLEAGKLDLALPLMEETLKLQKAKFGPEHPETVWATNDLAHTYRAAGKLDLAVPLFEETLKLWKALLGPENPNTLSTMAALGGLRLQKRNFGEAELLLRECLAIREKTQPDVWNTFNTQSMLGEALVGQQKYADAEPLLLKGYEGMRQREKAITYRNANSLPDALDRLIALYTATNRPDEVKKWQAERAKYPAPGEKK